MWQYVLWCIIRPGELLLAAHVVGSWDVLKSTSSALEVQLPKYYREQVGTSVKTVVSS